jgi:hypothetical protein
LTHEAYQAEDAETVDWAMAFAEQDVELEQREIEKAKRGADRD